MIKLLTSSPALRISDAVHPPRKDEPASCIEVHLTICQVPETLERTLIMELQLAS